MSRATIPAVRKSTDVPRPGFWWPARLEGRYQVPGARGWMSGPGRGSSPNRSGFGSGGCALAPFGAPRTMQGSPDMLWRPRCPFGGGLASHPKIQAPHAVTATAIGFPMRPSVAVVALQRRRFAERPGRRAVGPALGGVSSDMPVRAGEPGRDTAVFRRLPPCAWRIVERASPQGASAPRADATRWRLRQAVVRPFGALCAVGAGFVRNRASAGGNAKAGARLSAVGSVVARVSAGRRKGKRPLLRP
jgi:hypothetical protein